MDGIGKAGGCQVCIPGTILLINTVETFLIGHGFTQICTDTFKNSKVKADQIRTLDKSRLVKMFGELGIAGIN